MKYPVPDYAVSMWVAGDDLWISFPGQGPEARDHAIKFPASSKGFETAIKILRERNAADRRIGTPAAPTQYQLEAQYGDFLARLKLRKEQAAVKETARKARLEEERMTALQRETMRRAAAEELKELGL